MINFATLKDAATAVYIAIPVVLTIVQQIEAAFRRTRQGRTEAGSGTL